MVGWMIRGGSQGSPLHLQSTQQLSGRELASRGQQWPQLLCMLRMNLRQSAGSGSAHGPQESVTPLWTHTSAGWEVSWPADGKCSVIRRLMDKNWRWSLFDNSSANAQKQPLSFIIIIVLLLFSFFLPCLSLLDYCYQFVISPPCFGYFLFLIWAKCDF